MPLVTYFYQGVAPMIDFYKLSLLYLLYYFELHEVTDNDLDLSRDFHTSDNWLTRQDWFENWLQVIDYFHHSGKRSSASEPSEENEIRFAMTLFESLGECLAIEKCAKSL